MYGAGPDFVLGSGGGLDDVSAGRDALWRGGWKGGCEANDGQSGGGGEKLHGYCCSGW